VLESPFGSDGPAVDLPADLPTGGVPSITPGVPPPAAGPAVVQPAAKIGPLVDHCESAHPLRRTACSKGALMAVGLVGLIATAGVGALDWQHERRRRAKAAAGASEVAS
jgi:hypothetical protein